MKESGEMRFKQAIYGSTQAPILVNGDAQKRYSSRKSLAVPNPQPLIPLSNRNGDPSCAFGAPLLYGAARFEIIS